MSTVTCEGSMHSLSPLLMPFVIPEPNHPVDHCEPSSDGPLNSESNTRFQDPEILPAGCGEFVAGVIVVVGAGWVLVVVGAGWVVVEVGAGWVVVESTGEVVVTGPGDVVVTPVDDLVESLEDNLVGAPTCNRVFAPEVDLVFAPTVDVVVWPRSDLSLVDSTGDFKDSSR